MIIRAATIQDLDGIVAIESSCFPKGDQYSRRTMAERITGKDYKDIPEEKERYEKEEAERKRRYEAYVQSASLLKKTLPQPSHVTIKGFTQSSDAPLQGPASSCDGSYDGSISDAFIPEILPADYWTEYFRKKYGAATVTGNYVETKPIDITSDDDPALRTKIPGTDNFEKRKSKKNIFSRFFSAKSLKDYMPPSKIYVPSITHVRKYYVAEDDDGVILGYGEVAIQDKAFTIHSYLRYVERTLGRVDDKVGAIISIGVSPDAQGKGVGTKILESEFDFLKENQIMQVFAHAWPNGGFPYLGPKNGFKQVEGWKGRKYTDDSVQTLYFKALT